MKQKNKENKASFYFNFGITKDVYGNKVVELLEVEFQARRFNYNTSSCRPVLQGGVEIISYSLFGFKKGQGIVCAVSPVGTKAV